MYELTIISHIRFLFVIVFFIFPMLIVNLDNETPILNLKLAHNILSFAFSLPFIPHPHLIVCICMCL